MPDPLAGRGEDRVRDSRGNRRNAHLSHACGTLVAFDDIHFHKGHLVHLKNWIIMEVALLDTTLLESGVRQRRAE